MPKSFSPALKFYPAYCFPLSPTYNTWARLTAADVHALKERGGFEGQNIYFHLNHPIKWIRLVGVIVALDVYPTRWIMVLDDSSGATIQITCGRPKLVQPVLPKDELIAPGGGGAIVPTEGVTATGRAIDLRGVDLGNVVKVKGGIGAFREQRQVLLERIAIIHTTSGEAAAWTENVDFRRTILDSPWVVSEKDEKRAKSKAECSEREQRAMAERKRRKQRAEAEKMRGPLGKEEQKALEKGKRVARLLSEEKKREEQRRNAAEREQEGERVKSARQTKMDNERRERDKARREHERRLREEEYERLKAQRSGGKRKSGGQPGEDIMSDA